MTNNASCLKTANSKIICSKKVFITAGSTNVNIDQVRTISNIFRGRTGSEIATHFANRGCEVVLATSSPWLTQNAEGKIKIICYKTFDQLAEIMEREIKYGNYDIVIQSAAISDYKPEGVYVKNEANQLIRLESAKKISSGHREMYIKMEQTLKLIDLVRSAWGFKGILIKFKLMVGASDRELINTAYSSMLFSEADMIVANCLEWSSEKAYLILPTKEKLLVNRQNLAESIYAIL